MKTNKKGAVPEWVIGILIILVALFVILSIFAPKIITLLWSDLFGEKCVSSGLSVDQSSVQIKKYLSNDQVIEALLAYRDFKDCFKDKTILFTQDEYEQIIEEELKSNKLSLENRMELLQQYVDNYPKGKLAAQAMLILSYNKPGLAITYLESIIKNYKGDPSKEKEVCEAYYNIITLKKSQQNINAALTALQELQNNWDKCKRYTDIYPEGAFIGYTTKEKFFADWAAEIKLMPGEKTEKQKTIEEIGSAETLEQLQLLLEKYKGKPEETWINYKIGKIYYGTIAGSTPDFDKAILYLKNAYGGEPYTNTLSGENINEKALLDLAALYNKNKDSTYAYIYYTTYIREYPIGKYSNQAVDEIISIAKDRKDSDSLKSLLETIDSYISNSGFSNIQDDIKNEVYSRRLKVERELTNVGQFTITITGKANRDLLHWFGQSFSLTKESESLAGTLFRQISITASTTETGDSVNHISSIDNIKLIIPGSSDCSGGKIVNSPKLLDKISCSLKNIYNQQVLVELEYQGLVENQPILQVAVRHN